MDEPFYYRSAEDVIPEDAEHVIVCGSVRVVPPRAFEGCEHLKKVEFQEGVEAIGLSAFAECRNLERVVLSPSVRTIDDWAFDGCLRLSEVVLREGLEEIGAWAFYSCALERITVPSSVVTIGNNAFWRCLRLSEVNLTEGLRRIGAEAFCSCVLRQIAVPSSVVEIGREAFAECERLREVTLAGGMVMVARGAFDESRQLRNIATRSEAIVVEDGVHGNGRAAVVTGGTIVRDPVRRDGIGRSAWEPTRLILTSPYLAAMKSEDIGRAKDAINRIAGGRLPGEGPLDVDRDGDSVVASGRPREGPLDIDEDGGSVVAGGRPPGEGPLDIDEDGDPVDEWDASTLGERVGYTDDEWLRVREGADRIRARFRGLLSAHRRAIASILERAFEPDVAGIIVLFLPDVEGR